MGRNWTGKTTVNSAFNINIKDFMKVVKLNRDIKDIEVSQGENGFKLNAFCATNDKHFVFMYSLNDELIEYKIKLISKKSNLGKGLVWYFMCPQIGKNCRILYLAKGSKHFMSFDAYKKEGLRLYYSNQLDSKKWKANGMYFTAKHKTESLQPKKFSKSEYNGKLTKKFKRFKNALEKSKKYDEIRCEKFILMAKGLIGM